VTLTTNPDVLADLVARRPAGQVVVGFAAETGDEMSGVLEHARKKLARKGCDLLVVNAVGDGRAFEVPHNTGWLLAADGSETTLPEGPKALLASLVWDAVAARLPSQPEPPVPR
jgi:phosphopantothenoylcysteine decarboxylase/phosphopantothenate--cysteine ligase